MKSGKSVKYGVGFIIADCLLIVEAVINLRTGRITGFELFVIVALSIIFGIILFALAKKYVRGKRKQISATKAEVQENTFSAEESENNTEDRSSSDTLE